MAEKRTFSGAPRRIKALLSSLVRLGGSDGDKGASETDGNKSASQPTSTPARTGDKENDVSTPGRRSFRPLNREDFFHRLNSFTAFTWFAKPSQLSPLQCARYGWENIEADTLKCMSCKEILFAGMPPKWENKQYDEACARLQDSLVSAHSKICPWPGSPSSESFLEIPLIDTKGVVEEYCSRVSTMQDLGTSLPNLDYSSMAEQESFEPSTTWSRLQGLVEEQASGDNNKQMSKEEDVAKTSCILALLGWRKSPSNHVTCPVIECKFCSRHAGLWNFASLNETPPDSTTDTEESHTDEQDTEEPSAKRLKQQDSAAKTQFNPVTEHRSWCPWICQSVNHLSDSITEEINSSESTPTKDTSHDVGWQKLLVVLLKRTDPDRQQGLVDKSMTPPSQAWKTVRKVLTFWQSKDVDKAEEATEATEEKDETAEEKDEEMDEGTKV